jgi:hypothetical protein
MREPFAQFRWDITTSRIAGGIPIDLNLFLPEGVWSFTPSNLTVRMLVCVEEYAYPTIFTSIYQWPDSFLTYDYERVQFHFLSCEK